MGKGQQIEWSEEETRDLIHIRGQFERNQSATAIKSKKRVWELVSSQMQEKGHARSPQQCKCKWKNLLARYKGKETADSESGKLCPFFDELHEVFTGRGNKEGNDDGDGNGNGRDWKKRKVDGRSVAEMLREFLEYQQRMEMDWRKRMERSAYERRLFEQELRALMEKRERERLIDYKNWLEIEEQRRIREEKRAETRHVLITTLLTQLLDDKS